MLCTALPTLAKTRFPRLYELSSFVRPALINMGSVLTANSTVETDPARTATVAMWATLRSERLPPRRVPYPSCGSPWWVNSRTPSSDFSRVRSFARTAAATTAAGTAFQPDRGT